MVVHEGPTPQVGQYRTALMHPNRTGAFWYTDDGTGAFYEAHMRDSVMSNCYILSCASQFCNMPGRSPTLNQCASSSLKGGNHGKRFVSQGSMRKGNSFNQPSTAWPVHPKWGRTVPNASKLPTAAEESEKKDGPSGLDFRALLDCRAKLRPTWKHLLTPCLQEGV